MFFFKIMEYSSTNCMAEDSWEVLETETELHFACPLVTSWPSLTILSLNQWKKITFTCFFSREKWKMRSLLYVRWRCVWNVKHHRKYPHFSVNFKVSCEIGLAIYSPSPHLEGPNSKLYFQLGLPYEPRGFYIGAGLESPFLNPRSNQ